MIDANEDVSEGLLLSKLVSLGITKAIIDRYTQLQGKQPRHNRV